MSRLEILAPSRASVVMEGLYKDLERRIESSPPGLCPVDMARAFLELCHAQTCGKCVPCRIGLGQLGSMITDVLDGRATMRTLHIMEETALAIMTSADCAIGYEAAHMVYKGLIGYREDYEEHIKHGRCTCSYNQPVPCVSRCPAHVDIPGYISLIGAGRYADAIKLIRKDNPFPTACSFICEHPCENRCRRNMVDNPINIRGLKRYAADHAGEVPQPPCAEFTGKKVAIVGGGPGGLSSAYYLRLMGHDVTVYESSDKLGGMLRYGIPNYRLPKDRLDEDIDAILSTGVTVKYNARIGRDISIDELRKTYDAVLITIGASGTVALGLPGEDAIGVLPAIDFLSSVAKNTMTDMKDKEVIVIGGGNVSMDAVRTAKRLGARKVSIVYRRRIADMTSLPQEIEGAIAEGIEMQVLRSPSSLKVDDTGHIRGLYVTPQMVSNIKDGRAGIKPSGEPNILIPCDVLIIAIGQSIETKHFEEAGIPVSRGKIVTEKSGSFTDMPDVFAGGDCASGPSTVIKAIAASKVMAANIDEYLGFHHIITCDVEIPIPNIDDRIPCGRAEMSEREAGERVCDFDGVENCLSEAQAMQESSRCLRCDHFGYGIFKGGREKLW